MTTATFYRSVDKQLYDEEAELRKKKDLFLSSSENSQF